VPLTIIDALRRSDLLGAVPSFRDLSSWSAWLTYLRALYGLDFVDGDLERYRKHTGRTDPPPREGFKESVVIVGRQAAKSRIAATVCAWEAIRAGRSGSEYAVVLAQDARASKRAIFAYLCEPFQAEGSRLAELVKAQTVETLTLTTGVTAAVYPTRAESVRGIRARVVAVDELAFVGSVGGRDEAREILTAIRPCLATTGGRLLILSSPGPQSGALFELYRGHYGVNASPVLVWQASAPEMNPTLPADYIARMEAEDPVAYRSEVLGEWKVGTAGLYDRATIESALVMGRAEIPPAAVPSVCRAYFDGSGGRVDRAALAIAFRRDTRVVVAALRAWSAPHNPASVVAEGAELVRSYGIRTVTGDAYGGGVVESLWAEQGIKYVRSKSSASDLWMDSLSAVLAGILEMPDTATTREAVEEFLTLERVATGERDRVQAPRTATHHCDASLAVAGVLSLFPRKREKRSFAFTTDALVPERKTGFVIPTWMDEAA